MSFLVAMRHVQVLDQREDHESDGDSPTERPTASMDEYVREEGDDLTSLTSCHLRSGQYGKIPSGTAQLSPATYAIEILSHILLRRCHMLLYITVHHPSFFFFLLSQPIQKSYTSRTCSHSLLKHSLTSGKIRSHTQLKCSEALPMSSHATVQMLAHPDKKDTLTCTTSLTHATVCD